MIGSIANNRFLQRVNPEIKRALADSGSSLEHPEIQQLMRQMVDLDIADNLKLWVHSGLVKTRTSGSDTFVSKVYDISGEENDAVQATNDNQPKLVSLGMEFDGSDDFIETGFSYGNTSNSISVMLWLYVNVNQTFGTWDTIIAGFNWASNTRGYGLFSHSVTNSISFRMRSNTGGAALYGLISNDEFGDYHHIVFQYDSVNNQSTIYKNGTIASTVDHTPSTQTSTVFRLGGGISLAGSSGSYGNLLGITNDIRIYNKALSATEISAIYNTTKSKYGH